jgi:hypothetical protein
MTKLEQLPPGALVSGLLASGPATVVAVTWIGSDCINLTYRSPRGEVGQQLLYRDAEYTLSLDAAGWAWSFDADGNHFRLGTEVLRIHPLHRGVPGRSHHRLHYVQRPFDGKGITSDFRGATVNFPMVELLASAEQIA